MHPSRSRTGSYVPVLPVPWRGRRVVMREVRRRATVSRGRETAKMVVRIVVIGIIPWSQVRVAHRRRKEWVTSKERIEEEGAAQ